MKKLSAKFSKAEIEKMLLPRLQIMGFLLLSFSLGSLLYAVFAKPYTSPAPKQHIESLEDREESSGTFPINEAPAFELSKEGRMNFYAISGVFCAVGITCLVIAKKKTVKETTDNSDAEENN